MNYIKYARRENNIYYRRRKRAVGSHTRWGEHNPHGLSSYLNGEKEMTAEERKNSLLPSGWTIAKSWAALRKCWLGFDITKDQGDRDGMVEYAYRIRKIQAEMGIKPTNFDSDILDENTVNRIDALYRKSPPPFNEAVKNCEQQTDESNDLDYGQIMDGSYSSSQSIPAPRQEIFTTRLSRRSNSCPSPGYQPHTNSCYFGPPKPANQSQEHVEEIKTIYKKQRQAPPTNQDNFAVSAPENTLAVPNPNRPPIEPILRGKSSPYQLVENPPHSIHKDKSCPSDPQVNQMQRNKKEKANQRRAKSCPYASQH
jgi:hypothetical protein